MGSPIRPTSAIFRTSPCRIWKDSICGFSMPSATRAIPAICRWSRRWAGSRRLKPPDPAQRLLHRQMAGMARVAEGIENPQIESFQMRQGLVRKIADVGRIGDPIEAKAECIGLSVPLKERHCLDNAAGPVDADHVASCDVVRTQHGRVLASFRRLEAIGKSLA